MFLLISICILLVIIVEFLRTKRSHLMSLSERVTFDKILVSLHLFCFMLFGLQFLQVENNLALNIFLVVGMIGFWFRHEYLIFKKDLVLIECEDVVRSLSNQIKKNQ